MFNLFNKAKRLASIEIKDNYLRFVEVFKSGKYEKIISYGETINEEGYFLSNDFNKDLLFRDLKEIKSKLRTDDCVLVLPDTQIKTIRVSLLIDKNLSIRENLLVFMKSSAVLNFDEDILFFDLKNTKDNTSQYDVFIIKRNLLLKYKNLFKTLNIKILKFTTSGFALINSCVPKESLSSFMVYSIEDKELYISMISENSLPVFYLTNSDNKEVISTINNFYVNWYHDNKEKIHNVIIVGKKVSDQIFVDLILKETKLHIQKGNVFVNFNFPENYIPIIEKQNSYKYAVTLGAVKSS